MAKAAATKKKQTAGPADVATIDRQIATLLQQRAEAVKAVPAPASADSCALGVDELALAKIVESTPGPLACSALRAVFREIMSGCRALVRPLRIALLGPVYSYSHLAAMHRFGRSVEFVPVATIPAVFEEVDQLNFRLWAWCRSRIRRTGGSPIRWTCSPGCRCEFAAWWKCKSTTCCWASARGARSARSIAGRRPSASAGTGWRNICRAARMIEVTSTTAAAQLAAEKVGAAAIASQQAGVEYHLQVLAENIEDNPRNATRFAVIGGKSPVAPATTARRSSSKWPIVPARWPTP